MRAVRSVSRETTRPAASQRHDGRPPDQPLACKKSSGGDLFHARPITLHKLVKIRHGNPSSRFVVPTLYSPTSNPGGSTNKHQARAEGRTRTPSVPKLRIPPGRIRRLGARRPSSPAALGVDALMERIAESREASSVAASASTARRDATACECHLKTRPRSQRIFSALVFGERSGAAGAKIQESPRGPARVVCRSEFDGLTASGFTDSEQPYLVLAHRTCMVDYIAAQRSIYRRPRFTCGRTAADSAWRMKASSNPWRCCA